MENNTEENYQTIKNDQENNSPPAEVRTYIDEIFNSTNIVAWSNITL